MNNIKNIIFDLDNTLIYWKDEYISALIETLKEFKIDTDVEKVDRVIDDTENNFYILSKDEFLKYINEKCNLNLDISFVDLLFEKQKKLAPYDKQLIDLIEYLSQKYTLILYTNYFHDVQAERLETAGILKYFSKIYGGDDVPLKPNLEGFEKIIGSDNKDSYVMIGDSIKHDINGALNFGIKAILYDYKNKIDNNKDYIVIKKLEDLKEIL